MSCNFLAIGNVHIVFTTKIYSTKVKRGGRYQVGLELIFNPLVEIVDIRGGVFNLEDEALAEGLIVVKLIEFFGFDVGRDVSLALHDKALSVLSVGDDVCLAVPLVVDDL